jgi:mono/diheme cytochrome c family protein
VAPAGESAARIRIGASIFRQYCIVRHGTDGTGTAMRPVLPPIPDFTSPAFHKDHSDAQLQVSIMDGKGTFMPANRGRITEDQASDLVAFVRAFGPRVFAARPQASDSEFEKAYRQLEDQWNELEKELQKYQARQ